MSAPTKYSAKLQAAIVRFVEAGNSVECAAEANGVTGRTAYNWLARGREGDPEYVEFFHAIQAARANAEAQAVSKLFGHDDWRAAESWLKRARNGTWGDKQALDIKSEALVDLQKLSRDELLAYYRLRVKATTSDTERAEIERHIEALEGLA